jgi:prepilin-type N-terminal cleavage/methylation domain-containing protein
MKRSSGNRGFSLVEVLMAASVITLSLVAVVTFVRKGQEMTNLQKHRAMARGFVQSQLENPPFQPEYYNTLSSIPSLPTDSVVDIDAAMNLHGALTVSIGAEQADVNGIASPYRPVTATVIWTEPGGDNDTVTMTKWLADVQRD